MQVTRHRIWNSITVITTAAAIAGICSLSPVSASDGDKAPAPQASTPAPEAMPSAPVAAPTEAAAGNASDVPETNQPQPPKPGLTEEQIRAAMAEADKRRLEQLKPDPAIDNKVLSEKWGVEVIGINLTSAGYMLDFRFRVVDAEKALPLFDHRIKPYVKADKSDIKLPVPMAAKVGAFRPTNRGKNIKSSKTYYMVFANPDSYVKPGEKVSVFIGDFKAENLTVQ